MPPTSLPTPTPEQVAALLRDTPGTVWLDGGDRGPWSVLVWAPSEVMTEADDWPAQGRALTHRGAGDPDLPFTQGVVGYVGYGAGPAVAPVHARQGAWEPTVWLGRFEGALLYHHPTATWHPTGTPDRRRRGRDLLARARPLPAPPPPPKGVSVTSCSRESFLDAIRSAKAWIAEGDCYQLNLSRQVIAEGVGDAWEAWRRIRAKSHPPHGAWLVPSEGLRILCNSPETLLSLKGREAVTVPIKGTRPRGRDASEDRRHADTLRHSDKELAELTMIVDLSRNDLGRVAVPGSVRAAPRAIVPHANVLHAEQPVHAMLREDVDAWDALAALFPPGSVTGAPKIRATARIAELETTPRGLYCGAIGMVSDHGLATFNVAIRTAVVRENTARWHVGGGIVADSVPEEEWEETVTKGSVLARAFTGTSRH